MLNDQKSCDAKITINGFTHECHMEVANDWHEGKPHVARVVLSQSIYDSLDWEVKEDHVILNVDPGVAAAFFRTRRYTTGAV